MALFDPKYPKYGPIWPYLTLNTSRIGLPWYREAWFLGYLEAWFLGTWPWVLEPGIWPGLIRPGRQYRGHIRVIFRSFPVQILDDDRRL